MIDIIVLNYNNNGLIQECLEGIYNNTDGKYNLVVVDQNSNDGSREWLIKHKPSHLILNKRNVGIGSGRNQAIRATKNDWIIIIDSDMIINDKSWLDKIWNYMLNKKVGFINVAVTMHSWDSGKRMFAGSSFFVVRRQCFNEIGYFDKRFIIGEDDDWFCRYAWNKHWETEYCSDTNILHYQRRTTQGVLGMDEWHKLVVEYWKILKSKYTEEYIDNTLKAFHIEREEKEKTLLGGV